MATHWLQVMFSLAAVWAAVPLPLALSDWIVARFAPETHPLHDALEAVLGPAVIALATVVVAAFLRRFARRFLRVPEDVAPRAVLYRFVLAIPLSLVACFVLFGLISIAIDPPPWSSDNPQRVPMIFFLGTLGPMLFTPVVAVVAAWWWTRRRVRRAGTTAPAAG